MAESTESFDRLADSLDEAAASLDGAGDRLDEGESRGAYRQGPTATGEGKGEGEEEEEEEEEEGQWQGVGTPGVSTPPQSPSSPLAHSPLPPPSSSLSDRRSMFGPGGKSARFPQMGRSSSRNLAADVIPQWRAGGRVNMKIKVLQHKTLWEKVLNTYNWVFKLSLPRFVLWVVSAPILLAALFTPLFLLKWRGFALQPGYDDGWISQETLQHSPGEACPLTVPGVCQALTQRAALALHVFIFALSLCTSFGGSPLSALSPSVVFLSNALTLCAQLLFVLVSGAVFARIARPGESLRAADKIIIAYQVVPGTGPDVKRALFTRLALVGVNAPEMINVTISINFRIFMATSTGSYFVPVENLSLVRGDVPLLRFGFMVRHIIDETSPLFEYSEEDLRANDASFMVTISGLERSSMHPCFYKKDYFAHDGDIVYDRDFEDMLVLGRGGRPTFDHSRLNLLRPEAASLP